jgi:uncharacterized protein (DUF1697 family)
MKKPRQTTFIALLRGINVGGHRIIPMADLRSLCVENGWGSVQSYVQSGNLVFSAAAPAADLETELEQLLEQRFGFSVPVIVRAAADWTSYVQSNPFPEASEQEPHRVMLALAKDTPNPDAVAGLRERASECERVALIDDGLWIHFGTGVGKTKLTPVLLDRLVGSPVTARNWRTVLKLGELAGLPS